MVATVAAMKEEAARLRAWLMMKIFESPI